MSKVKIQGNASGTGVLTVTAPNTSTDRTITLPDDDVTLGAAVGGANGVDFNDSVKARFGTGNDLEIHHDGAHSNIVDTGTGDLRIRADNLRLSRSSDAEIYLYATVDGGVDLYHNGSKKFETTANGIELQGKVEINSGFEFTAEGGSTRMSIAHNTGNVWIDGNCSAASFTDRTPYPETLQLAYDVINSHKKLPDGQYKADDHSKQLDHSQLHEYVKAEDNNRNMSGVISCLVEVIKDLSARIETLENA